MVKFADNNIEFGLVMKNLIESLIVSESLAHNNLNDHVFKWHYILTQTTEEKFNDLPVISSLKKWGVKFDPATSGKMQQYLTAKRKRYAKQIRTIQEIKTSDEFQRSVENVREQFGHVLNDGTTFYEYQIQDMAISYFKKRSLLAYEMGLGKTRTSLGMALCQPTNKKILIVTMSRNMNDWMREIHNLGYEDDYIVLNHPNDLKSNKRIHLVSYERWANEKGKTVYRKKVNTNCPHCNCKYKNSFLSKIGYCTVCKHKATQTNDRWSEKDLPTYCPDCDAEWSKGAKTCYGMKKDHEKIYKCGYSIIEEAHFSLSDFYKPNLYNACIVDEIHYIKNGDTRRSRAIRKIKTEMKIALSGTPAENGTSDLFWILGWLTDFSSHFDDPSTKISNASPFRGYGKVGLESFNNYYGGGPKRAVLDIDSISTRISNHEKLWDVLDSIMIRRRKLDEEVKTDVFVPKPIHHRYHIDMDQAERELYNHILEEFATWYAEELLKKESALDRNDKYKISTIEICSWMRKLQQAASCPWIFPEYNVSLGIKTAKYKYMESKIIEQLRKGNKVLIFSGHKETVEQLALSLDQVVYGKEADYIHGGVKKEDRWNMINKFQDPNDPLSILVLSHKTGCESYTLTEAKAVFLFDLDFNGKRMEQCYSRAVRLTQKDVVDVYWLMNTDTIDCNIHALNLSKISGVDKAIDRVALDFDEISKEFEGDLSLGSVTLDYEEFAKNMLASGTTRKDYEKYA